MYFKRLITAILCGALLLCSSIITYADAGSNDHSRDNIIITPQMVCINRAYSNLSINSAGLAQVQCYVEGYSGTVTKVSIEADLQQYKDGDWVTINSWYQSSSSSRLTLSKSMAVPKGYSYQVVADVTAYNGSDSETQTIISSEIDY